MAIPRPPLPSLPKEAPWKEIEAIAATLNSCLVSLNALVTKVGGVVPEPLARADLAPGVTPVGDVGIADGGSTTMLKDQKKFWMVNGWAGVGLRVLKPDGREYFAIITTNDLSQLTFTPAMVNPVERGDIYGIFPLVSVLHKATFASGSLQVTAAGTAQRLPNLAIPQGFPVSVIAQPANTGYIYIGKTKAEAESATLQFNGLAAGLAVSLKITNLTAVWVTSSVNAEGCSWIVETDT